MEAPVIILFNGQRENCSRTHSKAESSWQHLDHHISGYLIRNVPLLIANRVPGTREWNHRHVQVSSDWESSIPLNWSRGTSQCLWAWMTESAISMFLKWRQLRSHHGFSVVIIERLCARPSVSRIISIRKAQILVISCRDLAPSIGIDRSCQQRVELLWSF